MMLNAVISDALCTAAQLVTNIIVVLKGTTTAVDGYLSPHPRAGPVEADVVLFYMDHALGDVGKRLIRSAQQKVTR